MLPLERVGVGGAGRDHVGGDQDVLGADQGRVDQDVLHRGSGGSGCGSHGKGSLRAWSDPSVIPGSQSAVLPEHSRGVCAKGGNAGGGEDTRGRVKQEAGWERDAQDGDVLAATAELGMGINS